MVCVLLILLFQLFTAGWSLQVDRAKPCGGAQAPATPVDDKKVAVSVLSTETDSGSLLDIVVSAITKQDISEVKINGVVESFSQQGERIVITKQVPCNGAQLLEMDIAIKVKNTIYSAKVTKGVGCGCVARTMPCGSWVRPIVDNVWPGKEVGKMIIHSKEVEGTNGGLQTVVEMHAHLTTGQVRSIAVNGESYDGGNIVLPQVACTQQVLFYDIIITKEDGSSIALAAWKEVGCTCMVRARLCGNGLQPLLHPVRGESLGNVEVRSEESITGSKVIVSVTSRALENPMAMVQVGDKKYTVGSTAFTSPPQIEACGQRQFLHIAIDVFFVDGTVVRTFIVKHVGCLCEKQKGHQGCEDIDGPLLDAWVDVRGHMSLTSKETGEGSTPHISITTADAKMAVVQIEMFVHGALVWKQLFLSGTPMADLEIAIEKDLVPQCEVQFVYFIAWILYEPLPGEDFPRIVIALIGKDMGCLCAHAATARCESTITRNLWVPYPTADIGDVDVSYVQSAITVKVNTANSILMRAISINGVQQLFEDPKNSGIATLQMPCDANPCSYYNEQKQCIAILHIGVQLEDYSWASISVDKPICC